MSEKINYEIENETTGGKPINYTVNYGNFIQQGWQCPICKKILAPFMTYCPFCPSHNEENIKWTDTSTTKKQRKQNFYKVVM